MRMSFLKMLDFTDYFFVKYFKKGKNIMKNYFLTIPNEVLMTNHKLHYEMFKINDNLELKIFLAVLAMSSMIAKSNKEFDKSQTFPLKGFLSRDSFIPSKNTTKKQLEEIINNFEMRKIFDELSSTDGVVSFTFSKDYQSALKSKGFQKVDLMKIRGYKDVNTTKIAILQIMKPKGYFYLNYLIKLLNLPDELQRASKIRAIKRAFSKVNGITFSYVYPKKGEAKTKYHYRFNYEPVEIEKIEELEDVNIEEIKEFIEEEYTTEYFDIEPEKVEEIEKEEPFEVDFDFMNKDIFELETD